MKIRNLLRTEYDKICNECMFDKEECKILEALIKGHTVVQMSLEFHCSTSRIDKKKRFILDKIKKVI